MDLETALTGQVTTPAPHLEAERQQAKTNNHVERLAILPGNLLGPAQGPSISQPSEEASAAALSPQSPYTASRQLLHSLTLPPIPNVVIPPSPPGSPRPSTSAKFERFLELKNNGIHFNAKLTSSSALRNPGLLQTLMDFAEINEEHDQYTSVLRPELAVVPPDGFSSSAFAEELDKQVKAEWKRMAAERRDGDRPTEFTPASQNLRMPGRPEASDKKLESGVERITTSLNNQNPRVRWSGKLGLVSEHRKPRFEDREKRRRSVSQSPKRRKGDKT